ncbi:uncharacterized protein LOC135144283 [Zophobas morio]|uniref:uncharacterized protein LOC135144283 n=1 Tax=Zophobas morio TaxID=2755281 RepID=UPI003083E755
MRESYPLRRYMQGFAMILDEAVVKEIFMRTRSKSKLDSFNFAGLFSHEDNDDLFCVTVYNDEVHSFTEVTEAFQVVGCSYEDADSLANEVDRKRKSNCFFSRSLVDMLLDLSGTSITVQTFINYSLMNNVPELGFYSKSSSPLELFIKGDLTVTHWWKVLRVRFS